MDQKPSVGRIIHVADEVGRTCAAIITFVHSDRFVNATRFNPDGSTAPVQELEKVHSPPKGTADWNWPPRD